MNQTNYMLGINLELGRFENPFDHVANVAEAGFDACFCDWEQNAPVDYRALAKSVRANGLIFQSVHAPFDHVQCMWDDDPLGDAEVEILKDCLHTCVNLEVPIMVVHPIKGMDRHSPNMRGIDRFARLVKAAEGSGVRLAFENVEGIEYLQLIIRELGSSDAVGYCWDTGHEMCYNFSMDVPALFGDKLICTHLNDNLGQSDPEKKIVTWLDDSHLFPFDGVADWQGIAERLDRSGFSDIMTFELTLRSKPGRNTHGIYEGLNDRQVLDLAYQKACRVAALRK